MSLRDDLEMAERKAIEAVRQADIAVRAATSASAYAADCQQLLTRALRRLTDHELTSPEGGKA